VESTASANRFGQDEFANLLDRTLDTPGALMAALLVAVGLGAAHALTPGHGKTIVGAYLVGSRGKARHALILGLTTTVTHTAGVFALGFLVLVASEFILPEKLYPWLGVMSGLLVVFIGASILRGHVGHWLAHRRGNAHDREPFHFHFGKGHTHGPADHDHNEHATRSVTGPSKAPVRVLAYGGSARPGALPYTLTAIHPHDHDSRDHTNGHDHPHSHDHSHRHDHAHESDHLQATAGSRLPEASALSMKNLLALGISGGLLPCPSALILMLSAIALRQVGLGLTLIVAFSVGLAGVLTGIGLIMVYAGRFLERLPIRHSAATTRLLPMVSATFITLAGLLITLRALVEVGVL
jgi:ABC-type nickel/cobalt efflux system permease component RcnA